MDTKSISMVSGTALLALTATASAGPMSVATANVIAPCIVALQYSSQTCNVGSAIKDVLYRRHLPRGKPGTAKSIRVQ
jgi:hypothetical protein